MTEKKKLQKVNADSEILHRKLKRANNIGRRCPLVVTYCKDNLQVVEHVDFFGETFAAPPHQVVLTAAKSDKSI